MDEEKQEIPPPLPVIVFAKKVKKQSKESSIDFENTYKEALKMDLNKLYSLSNLVRKQAEELMVEVEADLLVKIEEIEVENEVVIYGDEEGDNARRNRERGERGSVRRDRGSVRDNQRGSIRENARNSQQREDYDPNGEQDWAADEYEKDYGLTQEEMDVQREEEEERKISQENP